MHTSGVRLGLRLHCLSDEWVAVGISLWIYRWRKWVRAYIWVGSATKAPARDKNSIPRAASLGSLQGLALPPMPPCLHLPSLDTHSLLFWSMIHQPLFAGEDGCVVLGDLLVHHPLSDSTKPPHAPC